MAEGIWEGPEGTLSSSAIVFASGCQCSGRLDSELFMVMLCGVVIASCHVVSCRGGV